MADAAISNEVEVQGDDVIQPDLLRNYRFRLCLDEDSVARALEVRRQIYVDQVGYAVPVPDAYDLRFWMVIAEEARTGEAVGSMRITPRSQGPMECEEYFTLPPRFTAPTVYEVNRLAILPAHRKSETFLPVVSLGLFKSGVDFLVQMKATFALIASRPERVWTYKWLRFQSTGMKATYAKLAEAEHELLSYDYGRLDEIMAGHPFRHFFLNMRYDEITIPTDVPPAGAATPHLVYAAPPFAKSA